MDATTAPQSIDQVQADIARYGVHVVHVTGPSACETFGYTIGLEAYGHPEVCLWAHDRLTTVHALRFVHRHIARGDVLPVGREQAFTWGRDRCAVVAIRREHLMTTDVLLGATRHWRSEGHPERARRGVQIVVADHRRRLPWELGCDPSLVHDQVLLDETDPFAGRPDAAASARLRRQISDLVCRTR